MRYERSSGSLIEKLPSLQKFDRIKFHDINVLQNIISAKTNMIVILW